MINSRGIALLIFILTTCMYTPMQAQTINAKKTDLTADHSWQIVFADEFNGPKNRSGHFDTAKWRFCPRGHAAWATFLTTSPEYAYTDNGKLILRMDNKQIAGDNSMYHSGGLQSAGTFAFTYGKVEISAKFNQGKGAWPAIWLMPATATYGDWPQSGEIDVMEHINQEPVIHQTIHNAAVTGGGGGSKATHSSPFNENAFNTYGIVWDSSSIQFYVNHALQYTYTKKADATSRQWPFDRPFYLILNQSGGAGWPGELKPADLPFMMQVDWVRVYQVKGRPGSK